MALAVFALLQNPALNRCVALRCPDFPSSPQRENDGLADRNTKITKTTAGNDDKS